MAQLAGYYWNDCRKIMDGFFDQIVPLRSMITKGWPNFGDKTRELFRVSSWLQLKVLKNNVIMNVPIFGEGSVSPGRISF